jgi:hypothetical protein
VENALKFNMAKGGLKDGSLCASFALSQKSIQLTAQAHWYLYSTMHISKSEFESEPFIEMLQAMTGKGSKGTPVLSIAALKQYVRAEFAFMIDLIQTAIAQKFAQAKGNPFAQGIHDGGTLANKKKYQAMGIQFVDILWRCNHVLCIGLKRSSDNTDKGVAALFDKTILARTGLQREQVLASVIQDRAAKGVAGELDLEEEVCGMHDGDKLGQAAVGALVRTRMKKPVNPFPAGQALMLKAHKMGTHFSYSNRQDNLMAIGATIKNVPVCKIQVRSKTHFGFLFLILELAYWQLGVNLKCAS